MGRRKYKLSLNRVKRRVKPINNTGQTAKCTLIPEHSTPLKKRRVDNRSSGPDFQLSPIKDTSGENHSASEFQLSSINQTSDEIHGELVSQASDPCSVAVDSSNNVPQSSCYKDGNGSCSAHEISHDILCDKCGKNIQVNLSCVHNFSRDAVCDRCGCFIECTHHVVRSDIFTETESDRLSKLYSHYQDESEKNLITLLMDANQKVSMAGHGNFIEDFLMVIVSERLDLEGLTFKIIQETIQALCVESLTQMRFSWQSKCFWKLFMSKCGGMAIRLLSGWKCIGSLLTEKTLPGRINTEEADIILAIPNEDVLRKFDPYNGDWPSRLPPGFCENIAKSFAEATKESSVCIALDGKKITPGLKDDKGDINLLGQEEDGMTLKMKQDKFNHEQSAIQDLQVSLATFVPIESLSFSAVVSQMKWLVTLLSDHALHLEEEMTKKQYALEKLKKMGGEDYRSSKYCFVIQMIIATLMEIQECLDTGQQLQHHLCSELARLHGNQNLLKESPVSLSQLSNYCTLYDIDDLLASTDDEKQSLASYIQDLGPQYIKQHSSLWFSLRKEVLVTGSVLYSATGAGGLKAKREHYMHVVQGKEQAKFSDEVQAAIDHGQKYERFAMATFCTRFMPGFLPQHAVYEIGCLPLENRGVKILVSPDGAVCNTKTGQIEAVVEIKCPYTAPLHSTIPLRYYLQVQAEIFAMDVQYCFFVSFKESKTRVFKIDRDEEIWNLAGICLQETYGAQPPVIPSRLSESCKLLSAKLKSAAKTNCKLVAQLTSIDAMNKEEHLEPVLPLTSHHVPHPFVSDFQRRNGNADIKFMLSLVETAYAHNNKVHQLLRKKATELVTLVASDTDRLWSKNQLTGTPVCYFLKGYSLPMAVMRSILEDTLDKLHHKQIHVPCIAFDGQFMKLLREDRNGKPQTVLQLLKQYWNEVCQKSKLSIVSEIKNAGLVTSLDDLSIVPIPDSSNEHTLQPIIVERKIKERLPRSSHLIQVHSKTTTSDGEEHTDKVEKVTAVQPSPDENVIAELELQAQETQVEEEEKEENVTIIPNPPNTDSAHEIQAIAKVICDEKLKSLISDLSKYHGRWESKGLNDAKKVLGNCDELSKLKVTELKVVIQFVRSHLGQNISLSGSKADLIIRLKAVYQLDGELNLPSRKKSVKPLKVLTTRILQGQKYPKAALNISYAEWTFPQVLEEWQRNTRIKHAMIIPDINSNRHIDWFYVPEFSPSRRQLEVKKIDPHHLLTRHRSAICKGDLGHAKRQHFIQVAANNSTPLKLGMMEQQLNMQSTDFALITFSQKVQNCMETAGHSQSAELCKLVHDWFAASDEPGISAVERCQMKLRYRDYLLSLADLSSFPPPGSHIKGYPLALWEATISSIDADLQMYAITRRRTYNNRSLSSQPCESLYSSLATMPGAKNGVPSAVDLEVNMAKICGECVVRQDPTRGFSTRLSSAPVYPQMLLENGVGPLLEPKAVPTFISEITIQDHLFDAPQRRRLCRKEPKGISAIHEPGKGGHGVRHFHKIDESKLNPLIRAGISVNSSRVLFKNSNSKC